MVRLLDKNLDGDCRDSGELFWQLSDAQFSTVAVIDKNAVLVRRMCSTSYGVGTAGRTRSTTPAASPLLDWIVRR